MPYLSARQKEILIRSWKRYKITPEKGFELRRRAQTDLFFLSKDCLGWDKLSEPVHREICDFFVQKDPYTYPEFEDFCAADSGPHDRLLLVPRGGFKSTLDVCDGVQWIICYPNIAILILTAARPLAVDFVGELKSHFMMEEGPDGNPQPRTLRNGKPSLFQILFPECCFVGRNGGEDEFTNPARLPGAPKEPTVTAAGIDQNLSGYHYDILKADDCVSNENTKTTDRMNSVIKSFDTNTSMLNPGGYIDKIGTRYDDNDLYGRDMRRIREAIEEGEVPDTKVFLRSAAWLKEDFAKDDLQEIIRSGAEHKVNLWFPERLSMKELRAKLRKTSWDVFCCQYLNEPSLFKAQKFTRSSMVEATLNYKQIPEDGMICIAVDTAYSDKAKADYTVALAGLFQGGKLYVIDMLRGRYNEYELPQVLAAFIGKHKPVRTAFEDSIGVRWLLREVRREMQRYQLVTTLETIPLGKGVKNNKLTKAMPAIRLLGDKRLFFSNAIPKLDDLYDELDEFPGGLNDDIVSALYWLVLHFMPASQLPQVGQSTGQTAAAKEFSDYIYGKRQVGSFQQPDDFNPFASSPLAELGLD